jgi:hypothetical protein
MAKRAKKEYQLFFDNKAESRAPTFFTTRPNLKCGFYLDFVSYNPIFRNDTLIKLV